MTPRANAAVERDSSRNTVSDVACETACADAKPYDLRPTNSAPDTRRGWSGSICERRRSQRVKQRYRVTAANPSTRSGGQNPHPQIGPSAGRRHRPNNPECPRAAPTRKSTSLPLTKLAHRPPYASRVEIGSRPAPSLPPTAPYDKEVRAPFAEPTECTSTVYSLDISTYRPRTRSSN